MVNQAAREQQQQAFLATLQQDLARTDEALRFAEEEISKAERAGIDVSEMRLKLEEDKRKNAQIRRVYFPQE